MRHKERRIYVYNNKHFNIFFVALPLSIGVSTATDITPQMAAGIFFDGLSGTEETIVEQYIDNDYVNFICNNDMDSTCRERLQDALFKNFSYEVTDKGEKRTVAVLKLKITNTDFSGVQEEYESDDS